MPDDLERFIDPESQVERVVTAAREIQRISGYGLTSREAHVIGEQHVDFVEGVVIELRNFREEDS